MLEFPFILAVVGGGTKLQSPVSICGLGVIKNLIKIVILLNVLPSTMK